MSIPRLSDTLLRLSASYSGISGLNNRVKTGWVALLAVLAGWLDWLVGLQAYPLSAGYGLASLSRVASALVSVAARSLPGHGDRGKRIRKDGSAVESLVIVGKERCRPRNKARGPLLTVWKGFRKFRRRIIPA